MSIVLYDVSYIVFDDLFDKLLGNVLNDSLDVIMIIHTIKLNTLLCLPLYKQALMAYITVGRVYTCFGYEKL